MSRRYLFADEAGDFQFARGHNISRYFIVCTVLMEQCSVGNALLDLRARLSCAALRSYLRLCPLGIFRCLGASVTRPLTTINAPALTLTW